MYLKCAKLRDYKNEAIKIQNRKGTENDEDDAEEEDTTQMTNIFTMFRIPVKQEEKKSKMEELSNKDKD